MILIQAAAAVFLLLGSGLILYALMRLDRESETASTPVRGPVAPAATAQPRLPRAA